MCGWIEWTYVLWSGIDKVKWEEENEDRSKKG
jgi:hypothetical protein